MTAILLQPMHTHNFRMLGELLCLCNLQEIVMNVQMMNNHHTQL